MAEISKENIQILEFYYESGDDRSYGILNFKVEIKGIGLLELKNGWIASDSTIEVKEDTAWTLNGNVLHWRDTPDLEVPHSRATSRAVADYEEKGKLYLVDELVEWASMAYMFPKLTIEEALARFDKYR